MPQSHDHFRSFDQPMGHIDGVHCLMHSAMKVQEGSTTYSTGSFPLVIEVVNLKPEKESLE